MEYCIKILRSSIVRKKCRYILAVMFAVVLTAGLIRELEASKFTKSATEQNTIYDKDMGKELLSFEDSLDESSAVDIFHNILNRIPVKTNVYKLVKENRRIESVTGAADPEKTDLLSDIFSIDIEIPFMAGLSEHDNLDLGNIVIRIPDKPTGNFTPPVIPDIPAVNDKPSVPEKPAPPDKPIMPDLPAVPDTPEVPDTPIVPDHPATDDNPEAPPDVVVPDEPDVPGADEEPGDGDDDSGSNIEQPAGFTINEEGMICSFDPTAGVVVDGRLALPSTGCTGLLRETFQGVSNEIYELFIPPNIVNIEPGTFGEMADLYWIELTEPNENYTWQDGMLFDSSMTTLLAFPRGRIGTYSLPVNVTRLEDYSFLNTGLTKIDMVKCGPVEVGANVFGENGGNGITIMAPREYMEHYQNVFEGLGVTLR